jgi:LacI family repressor for deo operon, udp, cdd, tsx, nupC, and nupG
VTDHQRKTRSAAEPVKPLKMADVARQLGVSVATVSRALARPEQVSPELRDRVLKGVAEIGYTPNTAARTLRARRTMMILVVVPNISNPFFPEVLRGIDAELAEGGYGAMVGYFDNEPDKQARFIDIVQSGQVDGVLLLNGHIPAGGGRSLLDFDVPAVALSAAVDADIPQILVENGRASAAAVRHLADLGHRRLAYLSGPKGNFIEIERHAGFLEGIAACGLDPAEQEYWPGDYSLLSGAAAGRRFLAGDRRPTAVYATSDEMAIGFIKAVRTAGVRVPQDMSVVGFDGVEYADFCEPTLTTLAQPRNEMGRLGARRLMDMLAAGETRRASTERLPVRLLVRDSTAAAPDL